MKDSQQDVETMAAALRGKIRRGQDQTQSPHSLNLPPPPNPGNPPTCVKDSSSHSLSNLAL